MAGALAGNFGEEQLAQTFFDEPVPRAAFTPAPRGLLDYRLRHVAMATGAADVGKQVFDCLAGVVAAHEIGFWLGSLTRSADEAFDRQVALVRTTTAALVAFLVGFAFSGAASRFIDRLDIIVKEANSPGTAYLRADTIPSLNAAN